MDEPVEKCYRCGCSIQPDEDSAVLCVHCGPATEIGSPSAGQAPEFDHRGIQLPARTRVGGIITPQ